MYEFKIKKGTPCVRSRNGSKSKYPFHKLEPGTYMEIPSGHYAANGKNNNGPRISTSAYNYAKRAGIKVCVTKEPDGSVRVYRTE
jgi:hypothetical protein